MSDVDATGGYLDLSDETIEDPLPPQVFVVTQDHGIGVRHEANTHIQEQSQDVAIPRAKVKDNDSLVVVKCVERDTLLNRNESNSTLKCDQVSPKDDMKTVPSCTCSQTDDNTYRCMNCGVVRQRFVAANDDVVHNGGATPITEVSTSPTPHLPSNMTAVDTVLGGGIVDGAVYLLGGEPGIGKSTLLMQMAGGLLQQDKRILYISAEETAQRARERCERLGLLDDNLLVSTETEVGDILKTATDARADILLLDSIQRLHDDKLDKQPGCPAQMRQVCDRLLDDKGDLTVFIVGHVTKGGDLAGPKFLEHMVDVVLHFSRGEGDGRLLSTRKNRFGPTAESTLTMTEDGLADEATSPSFAVVPELNLEQTLVDSPACVVFEEQHDPVDDRWRVLHGDALHLLGCLPPESVDGVVTDPSYGSGTKLFPGDVRDQHSYLSWCSLWMSAAHRAAKPHSPICVFAQWKQLPVVIDALQAAGWTWRGIAVWDKTAGGARPQKGRFRDQCEYIVWGSKGSMPWTGKCLDGVWTVGRDRKTRHPTSKPVPLMEMVVEIVPARGKVLDPFCGSGSTLVAALRTGRTAIGIEVQKEHVATAVGRCMSESSASTAPIVE